VIRSSYLSPLAYHAIRYFRPVLLLPYPGGSAFPTRQLTTKISLPPLRDLWGVTGPTFSENPNGLQHRPRSSQLQLGFTGIRPRSLIEPIGRSVRRRCRSYDDKEGKVTLPDYRQAVKERRCSPIQHFANGTRPANRCNQHELARALELGLPSWHFFVLASQTSIKHSLVTRSFAIPHRRYIAACIYVTYECQIFHSKCSHRAIAFKVYIEVLRLILAS